ncbi:MAG: anaerobic ribonucleoside-triphosphate reductase, partial [Actinomycetota bacterium]|nr:anaerobic ribonucleoside-triphosphate reductase [Actinomycetota bacterium]
MTPRIQILHTNGTESHPKVVDVTDIALQVSTFSQEEINLWNKQKIVDSIVKEVQADPALAEEIADSVERTLIATRQTKVTTNLIRELVDLELMERGLSQMLHKHTKLGLPMFDVENIIFEANKENSNTTHNPESINLTLAEAILKQYALERVFSEDVAKAHYEGDIHLHDLGFCVRPYCGGHSLEYIKKYGLKLPNITSTSGPAKHPEVLIGHMVKMASTLQSYYAGAIGWEAVNVFFAPFLVGLSYERILQLAEMLIFEFNQLAGARGSQVVFTDFNLYYNVPKHLQDALAIGPGGIPTGKTYKEYQHEAQQFLRALFEVYYKGDATGKTFVFPKPLLHINDDFFKTEGWEDFLDLACKVASKQGITYFVFDRGDEVTVSQCCRLKLRLDEEDLKLALTPEKMRFTALQNVTINLPRIAYKAQGNDELLMSELEKAISIVAKAHLQKKKFITELMSLGSEGPVALLCMN